MAKKTSLESNASISIRDVRASDSDALGEILVTAENHAFRGLVPGKCLQFTVSESASNWKKAFARNFLSQQDVFIVADNMQKGVVAYAWGRPSERELDYQGELYQIHVLPDYQGQGIGRLLLKHLVQGLAKQSIHSMRVKVLQVNPNRVFYEHLGAVSLSQEILDWDGVAMVACIYGWKDTSNIFKVNP